ncbi:hypothetical protein MNBD_ACTINO01-290 [hydrothermal vent metagenome]|uniref:Uncharacterized protein n=1 Tax=hydrothermal vent metagenome TaxID=652676 RepID=A0A3B0T1Y0_9ZZZZ
MSSMRQRLLLVAGWLAAAVGSGLVASGAVAVAGGQVLDRPLRPLTAAEVAALPVVQVDSLDIVEPHASGGLEPTTGGITEGSADDAADSDESAGTRGSTAEGSDERTADPVGPNARAVVEIASVAGGLASFVVSDGKLILLWATPSAGYVAQTSAATDTSLTIQFSSSLTVWVLEATIDNGRITIETRTEPLT